MRDCAQNREELMKKIIVMLALAGLICSFAAVSTNLLAQEDTDVPSDNGGKDTVSEPEDEDDDQDSLEGEDGKVDESDLYDVDPWLLETDPKEKDEK